MTIELLIHAIVRQMTVLIAQLATSRGARAPLAHIANQVFMDLVRELNRQGVSRKVSADMFGLGLRTYRRKIQRLGESSTDRGRSLWEVVLEHIRQHGIVTRREVLARFLRDDEAQVRAVLRDLCESQLVFASGASLATSYRAATDDELATLQHKHGSEGKDELLLAIMYREGPLTLPEIAEKAQIEVSELEAVLGRLLSGGRIDRVDQDGVARYKAQSLVIPLGAPIGWEAAVFDHFKALVTTILIRLDAKRSPAPDDQVGGSTYTIELWRGHPMAKEVYGTLGRLRSGLTELRQRVAEYNETHPPTDARTRAVIYLGQYLIHDDNDDQSSGDD